MNSWRIVCVKRGEVQGEPAHGHVLGVGTGERADWADMRWELDQVLEAMAEGDRFFTQDERTGVRSEVEIYTCPLCRGRHLRSAEGTDPELDVARLRECIYT